jgi:hypothetical protein
MITTRDHYHVAAIQDKTRENIFQLDLSGESLEKFREEQLKDDTLVDCWRKTTEEKTSFIINKDDKLLYREHKIATLPVFQLVLPVSKRLTVIRFAHESCFSAHFGSKKSLRRIAAYFYWPNMATDVNKYVRSCDLCQKRIPITKADSVPIKAIPHSTFPFQEMYVDIAGPLEPASSAGHRYIICLVDSMTRWLEALPLRTVSAAETCNALMQMFCRVGFPQILTSDNASNFVAQLSNELYKRVGIKIIHSSPLHPQANGTVERANRSLKHMLHSVVKSDKPRSWHLQLPFLLFAYREMQNRVTSLSPMEMAFGRALRGPLSILKQTWTQNSTPPDQLQISTVKYMENLKANLQRMAEIAEKHTTAAQKAYVEYYNKTARDKKFEPGDLVLVLLPSSTNKLASSWIGPAEVLAKLSDYSYRISLDNGSVRVLHANRLRKYHSRVNSVGVLYESDEDFGRLESCPIIERKEESTIEEEIRQIDLSHLTETQAEQFRALLLSHKNVFNDRPGVCNVEGMEINWREGFTPKSVKPYRIPERLVEEVERQVAQLLEDGKITKSKSPYVHPVVCVKKSSGQIRMCTDMRMGNEGVIPDPYPLPNGEDLLMRMCPARFITTLDAAAGFFQLPIRESDRHKTAFATSSGVYQWCVTPFGARNASQNFQRVMDNTLRPHARFAGAYIDDISIYSLLWDAHLIHVDKVLTSLEDIGMSLKFSKCSFAKPQVEFLGHLVGSGTRSPLTDKVLAIREIAEPHSKKSLRSFLGAINFFRQYIPHFSELAYPLTELTKNSQANKFTFNQVQREAFCNLKEALCQCTCLYAVDLSKPFHMYTDASNVALGVALVQLGDDGKTLCPVAFASSKFSATQAAWATIERECYSIVYGLKKFEHILFGSEINVWTDHDPLTYISKVCPASPKLMRWALCLTRFNIVVRHIAGKHNVMADLLSRPNM